MRTRLGTIGLALAMGAWVMAAPPAWWTGRGVLNGEPPNDFAPVTAGQLKHMASKARQELEHALPDGAGAEVDALVAGFAATNNFGPITLGQLKQVARPFYDCMMAAGLATGYPWTVSTTDDADYAPANIGQMKTVFSFDLDWDGDGLPNWWETLHGLDPHDGEGDQGAQGDPDGDLVNNAGEFRAGTRPDQSDLPGAEIRIGTRVVGKSFDLATETIPGFSGGHYRKATVSANIESAWLDHCPVDGSSSNMNATASVAMENVPPPPGATNGCGWWGFHGKMVVNTERSWGSPVTYEVKKLTWEWSGTNQWTSPGFPYQLPGPCAVRFERCVGATSGVPAGCSETSCVDVLAPQIHLQGPPSSMGGPSGAWPWAGVCTTCGDPPPDGLDDVVEDTVVEVHMSEPVDMATVMAEVRAAVETYVFEETEPTCPMAYTSVWLGGCADLPCAAGASFYLNGTLVGMRSMEVMACVTDSVPDRVYQVVLQHIFVSQEGARTRLVGQTAFSGVGTGGDLILTPAGPTRIHPPAEPGCVLLRKIGPPVADIDIDSNYDDRITDVDDPIEKTSGGVMVVGDLEPVRLFVAGVDLPGAAQVRLFAVSGADKVRLWQDAGKTIPVPPEGWVVNASDGLPPITVCVEALTNSANLRDVSLVLEYINDEFYAVDEVLLTTLNLNLVPDWNHDRVIDDQDVASCAGVTPYRFWKNDDADDGNIAEGDSDRPGQDGFFGGGNASDGVVNGRCDLLDFFPLWVDLHETANLLAADTSFEFRLAQSNEAVRAVYTDLCTTNAGDFMTTEGNVYGYTLAQNASEADTMEVSRSGLALNALFLDRIKADPSKGVLMIEGRRTSNKPIRLEVWKGGRRVCGKPLRLSIDGVEKMYRWLNLRAAADGDFERSTAMDDEPENFPDAESNGKHFVFVHGYNVSESGARAWASEFFKRFRQSGSRAMFTPVIWHGNESQIHVDVPFLIDKSFTPNYYINVEHAFATADNVAELVPELPGSIVLGAHSLGNMLVSSAIRDHGLTCEKYFMFNAAVAMEAYDVQALSYMTTNMTNVASHYMANRNWDPYTNKATWASYWHSLAPFQTNAADGRRELTWFDRFGNITNAVNCFSSTEDVLDNSDSTSVTVWDVLHTRWAWANQERLKGTLVMAVGPGNKEGGWGFNLAYQTVLGVPPNSNMVNSLSDDCLATNPVFGVFDLADLTKPAGAALAADPEIRSRLLSDAIPALSCAAGRNPIADFGFGGVGLDLHKERRGDYGDQPSNWPEDDNRWHHSDLKNIAYPFNYRAFDKVVSSGGLK